MAVEITVPRLGWSMEEGVFVAWLKRDGDTVKAGEPLFTLEGDKAEQEVEAVDSGILHIPPDAPREGDKVAVSTVLGYLVQPGEPLPFETGSGRKPPVEPTGGSPLPLPSAATVTKVQTVPPNLHRPTASPRARRVAAELGIDWKKLEGSGCTGRIRERDVRAAASQPAAGSRVVPLSPTRKRIAERMLSSLHQAAPVTLTTTADATNLVNLREQFRAASTGAPFPGYTDFLIKLSAAALAKHPLLNATWQGDQLLLWEGVHIGVAVDNDEGLVVPVVRDADKLTLREVADRIRQLVEQARDRRLTPEQMQGGTFTVSNLGMYGIEAFTPIINPPQCAVLGIGRIVREPAVVGDQVVPRQRMVLSLTFDHRIVDGAPAARFLDTLRQCIEQPGAWLIP
jgi:pyruvate dehydrogenase E2 component (dihydrolipoamide acetyltransferase)